MADTTPPSLYDQIGGGDGVADLIDRFYELVMADPLLEPTFAAASMDRLRHMQIEFVGAALGGPVEYTGMDLAHAHAGRGITSAQYSAFAGHFLDSLEEKGLKGDTVQAVVDRLFLHADDIVGGVGEEG